MKKLVFTAALFFSAISFCQVGIGTTSPAVFAALDVTSTTKGLLSPRMMYIQKVAILSPVAGLQVWCINCGTNGEMQVFNGTVWTNISGTIASLATSSAPISPVATAGYMQARVAFTAPASNGGTVITAYTVTASPGGLTATGASSPLIVTGLTNSTSYTFTVVATNTVGNSPASSASIAIVPNCGAYIASGVYKVFACYNLGATDTTGDANTPVQGIHGNYYQWGRNTVVASASTGSSTISGWNTTEAPDNSWGTSAGDNVKNATNDPCPSGFRVPTIGEWQGVLNTSLNTVSKTGSWVNSSSNFTTAISFGTPTIKTLTLPAAGYRGDSTNGTLYTRGKNGFYWSSTESGTLAWSLSFGNSIANTNFYYRQDGNSVRCVSQ